ncbi:PhzF family phenazine biosynthesis protein [Acetobacter indonesiensis]|uniref:PhzF family phenazine biosynthesis protein n=1 Tax=Acetobacter indonesiensis TaxID=104101 RepID=UPI001F1BFCAF|nr:PhzF family phenazine biosynthesis protein [Acetobacter indonesiensis]MCG0996331.1 PhzF family phenazine biosynthesis protein [Acetobacter indonesiensis]
MDRRGFLYGALASSAAVVTVDTLQAATLPLTKKGSLDFRQVDVFSKIPLKGNPVAVVVGADHLSTEQMSAFSVWTNLSEATFLLKPTSPAADYRVRIFLGKDEVPFAGHPTLGTCRAWLSTGRKPKGKLIVQECGIGLVSIRQEDERLAFSAPPLTRTGSVDAPTVSKIAGGLGIAVDRIRQAQWVGNGIDWVAVMLDSREEVLAIKPDYAKLAPLAIGVIARCDKKRDNIDSDFEVRAFYGLEDPVTGSLNAGLAKWMIGAGIAPKSYIVSQGTAIGRDGRVYITTEDDKIWVGGYTTTVLSGTAQI